MGGNDSTSTSKPLTGPERAEAYRYGTSSIADMLQGSGLFNRTGNTPAQGEKQIWVPGSGGNGVFGNTGTSGHWVNNPNYVPAQEGQLSLNTDALGYTAPEYKALNNGDYNALEQNIIQSRTAPLDEAWRKSRETINQDAADRGLWSSGVPIKNEQDFYAQNFLPAYQQAGADAAVQRYTMQQQDLQNQNSANMENAQRQYESPWRFLDYGQGLYNQTGGVVSSGGSSGWSI
jgi:hypothetical protein